MSGFKRMFFNRGRYDNDHRARVFDTFEGGEMVTGVKLTRRWPATLWVVGPDGGLCTLKFAPRSGGGYDVRLTAAPSAIFDMQGLHFDVVPFSVVTGRAPAPPLAEVESRALDLKEITVDEAAVAGA
jgi:hypothetical protein